MRGHLALAARLRAELKDISTMVGRVQAAWSRATHSGDELYLDSVALNLHGFYAGIERIFELIADELTGVDLAVRTGISS